MQGAHGKYSPGNHHGSILGQMLPIWKILTLEGTYFWSEFLNSLHLLAVDMVKLRQFPVCVTSVWYLVL